jgi:hypothetical protein
MQSADERSLIACMREIPNISYLLFDCVNPRIELRLDATCHSQRLDEAEDGEIRETAFLCQ